MRSEICAKLIEFSQPKVLLPPWDRFCEESPYFCCPSDSEPLITSWLELADADVLIERGIVRDMDPLQLPTELCDPAGSFVLLEGGPAYWHILTATGLLGRDMSTLELAFNRARHRRPDPPAIYIVQSLDDLVALHALGLEACLADRLLSCTGDLLSCLAPREALEETFAIDPERELAELSTKSGSNPNPNIPWPWDQDTLRRMMEFKPKLVLVAWSPSRMCRRRPGTFIELAKWLFDCGRFGDRDLSRIVVWRPRPLSVERITYHLEAGDITAARSAVDESVEECGMSVQGFVSRLAAKAPANYVEAFSIARKFLNQTTARADSDESRRAFANLARLHERDIVEPLAKAALETSDPLRRSRLIAMSTLCRQLHRQAMRLERKLASKNSVWNDAVEQDLDRCLSLTRTFFQVSRGDQR